MGRQFFRVVSLVRNVHTTDIGVNSHNVSTAAIVFRSVLAFDEHRNYLGIGCWLGRGLLEVQER